MNPALIATFSSAAEATMLTLGGPLTRERLAATAITVRGIIQTAAVPVGDYGERMEQHWTLTIAASADVRIGDTVTRADPAGVFTLVQPLSNNGYIAVYALRPEAL